MCSLHNNPKYFPESSSSQMNSALTSAIVISKDTHFRNVWKRLNGIPDDTKPKPSPSSSPNTTSSATPRSDTTIPTAVSHPISANPIAFDDPTTHGMLPPWIGVSAITSKWSQLILNTTHCDLGHKSVYLSSSLCHEPESNSTTKLDQLNQHSRAIGLATHRHRALQLPNFDPVSFDNMRRYGRLPETCPGRLMTTQPLPLYFPPHQLSPQSSQGPKCGLNKLCLDTNPDSLVESL